MALPAHFLGTQATSGFGAPITTSKGRNRPMTSLYTRSSRLKERRYAAGRRADLPRPVRQLAEQRTAAKRSWELLRLLEAGTGAVDAQLKDLRRVRHLDA